MNPMFTKSTAGHPKGFTLVELLIALTIGSLVMTAVYSTYHSQQETYIIENQKAGMRQNVRAALFYMERELRMMGCDPTGKANAGVEAASANSIRFKMDITGGESDGKDNNDDGTVDDSAEDSYPDGAPDDAGEDITFSLSDDDLDGDNELVMTDNNTVDTRWIAENIDALDFVYLDEDSVVLVAPIDTSKIRAVQITVVARTGQGDPGYSNSVEYKNKQGTTILVPQNDDFRRIIMSTHIKCRNMGI